MFYIKVVAFGGESKFIFNLYITGGLRCHRINLIIGKKIIAIYYLIFNNLVLKIIIVCYFNYILNIVIEMLSIKLFKVTTFSYLNS